MSSTGGKEQCRYRLVKRDLCEFTWTVNNFGTNNDDNADQLPAMTTKEFMWKIRSNKLELSLILEMRVRGEAPENRDFVSLHLKLGDDKRHPFSDEEQMLHMVDFSAWVQDKNGAVFTRKREVKQREFKKDGECKLGWDQFYKRQDICDNRDLLFVGKDKDQLKLVCELSYWEPVDKTGPETIMTPEQLDCAQDMYDYVSALSLSDADCSKFADVTLCCAVEELDGGPRRQFPAHKAILSARSKVFAAMFECDMVENRENKVEIGDMTPEVLKKMLEFIYTGQAPDIDCMAQDLFVAADRYDLPTLKDLAESNLVSNLSQDNAQNLVIFADAYRAKRLTKEIAHFIMGSGKDTNGKLE